MTEKKLPSGFGTTQLREELAKPHIMREAFIEDILYEQGVLMLCADEGIGKSSLSLQLAVSLSNGIPCFGHFRVAKPKRVFYVVSERTYKEPFDRLRQMEEKQDINCDNLYFTTGLKGLNFSNPEHHTLIIQYMLNEIMRIGWDGIDVVFIDPLYRTIKGSLSDEKNISLFCDISDRIQETFSCSNVLIHHTNRGVKDKDSGGRMGRDMHGSGFFANHITGRFHISSHAGGTLWVSDKDSHDVLIDKIHLEWNPEVHMSTVNLKQSKGEKTAATIDFLKEYVQTDNLITIAQIMAVSKLSRTRVYVTVDSHTPYRLVKTDKSKGRTPLYRVEYA